MIEIAAGVWCLAFLHRNEKLKVADVNCNTGPNTASGDPNNLLRSSADGCHSRPHAHFPLEPEADMEARLREQLQQMRRKQGGEREQDVSKGRSFRRDVSASAHCLAVFALQYVSISLRVAEALPDPLGGGGVRVLKVHAAFVICLMPFPEGPDTVPLLWNLGQNTLHGLVSGASSHNGPSGFDCSIQVVASQRLGTQCGDPLLL